MGVENQVWDMKKSGVHLMPVCGGWSMLKAKLRPGYVLFTFVMKVYYN
jgi:hypothetical protein